MATDSEDQTRIPSVIFSYTDESGVEVTRSADVSADTGTTNESFIATYQLDSNDTGIESDVNYSISIHDRSGNQREYTDISSVEETVNVSNTLRIDTKAPDLSSISLETDNDGMTDSALGESYLLATTGDTLTLRFQTREEIIDPTATDSEDQTRIPSVIFSYTDESGVDVTRSADVPADTGTTNESFIATYQLDSDDTGIESDVNYSISIHDRSGNQREYTDISSVEETVGVSNTLRIDTKAPDLSSISFETDNDGMTDSALGESYLLATTGDTLTLRFQTREEIIDPTATDSEDQTRIPSVIFSYTDESGVEVTRSADVSADTGTTNESFI